jgi:hypothetical protein
MTSYWVKAISAIAVKARRAIEVFQISVLVEMLV